MEVDLINLLYRVTMTVYPRFIIASSMRLLVPIQIYLDWSPLLVHWTWPDVSDSQRWSQPNLKLGGLYGPENFLLFLRAIFQWRAG